LKKGNNISPRSSLLTTASPSLGNHHSHNISPYPHQEQEQHYYNNQDENENKQQHKTTSSSFSNSSQSHHVRFYPNVYKKLIPSRSNYKESEQRNMWSTLKEIQYASKRNILEFSYDSWNWRKATEEVDMYYNTSTGKYIHPAVHEFKLRQKQYLQQQQYNRYHANSHNSQVVHQQEKQEQSQQQSHHHHQVVVDDDEHEQVEEKQQQQQQENQQHDDEAAADNDRKAEASS
jgi:DNA segregation ATPase FtsK/SpoIIIE-like protein